MTPQEMSDIYNGYIDCLNDQAWSRLSMFVHDDVQHNESRIGVPGYKPCSRAISRHRRLRGTASANPKPRPTS